MRGASCSRAAWTRSSSKADASASDAIRAIVGAGIPVMGHLGLTPQSVHQLGGFRPQGKTAAAAKRLLEDALLLEEAGCFSLVLESVPARLAELVSTNSPSPPSASARASAATVRCWSRTTCWDLFDRFTPKFVKKYANFHAEMQRAFSNS